MGRSWFAPAAICGRNVWENQEIDRTDIYKTRKLWYNNPNDIDHKFFSEKEKTMEKIRIQNDLYTYANMMPILSRSWLMKMQHVLVLLMLAVSFLRAWLMSLA